MMDHKKMTGNCNACKMKEQIAPCHSNVIIIIYSSDGTATTVLLLEFIQSLNNHSLMEYWNSCFTEFS